MTSAPAPPSPKPPTAKRIETVIAAHGNERTDDYAWLKDPDWQAVMKDPDLLQPDIRAYLEAENAYTEAALAPGAALRRTLFGEMKARIKEDESSVPARDGDYAYYRRYDTGGQHPIFCRRPHDEAGGADAAQPAGGADNPQPAGGADNPQPAGGAAQPAGGAAQPAGGADNPQPAGGAAQPAGGADQEAEQILFHGDREGAGQAFFRIGACRHGPDHRMLAHTVDTNGSEYFTLRFRDLATGVDLADRIEGVKPGVVWANDGRTVFYVVLDDNHRPIEVRRHVLGTDPASDATVYAEPDAGFYLDIDRTESGRFVLIEIHDHATSEVRLIDADDPGAAPRLVAARETDLRYSVTHHGDRLLILTNADGAEDFKIVEAPVGSPDRENWRDLVPHAPGRLIRDMLAFEKHLVRLERIDGLPRIVITALATGPGAGAGAGEDHEIAFDEAAYDLGVRPGYEFKTATLRFSYSSMTTPERIYDYHMDRRDRRLRKEQEVPSGHDPADYVTGRLFAIAPDGEKVPVSLVHRRDTPLDGTAPLLLYGYGSYGISIPASFSANRFSLIDRGFVYAIAHIRGGMERGYRWYTHGKLMEKKNTFSDFIAAAEHLIATGHTGAGRIAAHGGSAGGMLVGGVANMRPDLFRAILAEVPFVDVLNTMCDADLPLTPPEWPEWGNPIEDAAAYDYIRSYSPYDNVAKAAYPAILVTAGLTDPRVTYWEPAKWVARLRALKTDGNLLLLRTNMEAGHAGAAGRFDRLDEVALVYGFVLRVLSGEP